jgi:hypothetical protein
MDRSSAQQSSNHSRTSGQLNATQMCGVPRLMLVAPNGAQAMRRAGRDTTPAQMGIELKSGKAAASQK